MDTVTPHVTGLSCFFKTARAVPMTWSSVRDFLTSQIQEIETKRVAVDDIEIA